jgi:hypothetical protein
MATSTDLRAAIEEVQRRLPAGQLVEGLEGLSAPAWVTRLERRVGTLPWWMISATVHAVIFLLATLLTVAMPPAQVDEVTISSDVAKEKPPEYDQTKPRDIFRQMNEIQHETEVENPVVLHEEAEVTDHFETDNDMDMNTARGHEDAISDIPLGGTGVVGSIGVGGGGMAGCYGYRGGGGRKHAVARFGGSKATESAVEAALRWLARHQEADGHWDGKKHGTRFTGNDTGISGLAVLAFLGAGYTDKAGKFKDNVSRALTWLRSQQRDADGAVGFRGNEGNHGGFSYNHAIAGLALTEAYGMTRSPDTGKAAQKAVDYSLNVMQRPYSGWRYQPKAKSDISVTGWYVMLLKSAKIAGLQVDGAGFQGAAAFVDRCTDEEGRVGYQSRKKVYPSTTGVGMVCRQFMGAPPSDANLKKGAACLLEPDNLPRWDVASGRCTLGSCTFYHWYYGTLAMFQMGGDDWKKWNPAMKKTLLPNQRKGGPLDGSLEDVDGSWDPLPDPSSAHGGRVYSTALGALTLEVYYRYLPMYAK